jgi:hypothetical protein
MTQEIGINSSELTPAAADEPPQDEDECLLA